LAKNGVFLREKGSKNQKKVDFWVNLDKNETRRG
jgi:hypothetical protein